MIFSRSKARGGLALSCVTSVFSVLRNLHGFPSWLHPPMNTRTPQARRMLCSPRPWQHLILCRSFGRWHPEPCELIPDRSFDWLFSNNDPGHLFRCFMAIWIPSLNKYSFRTLACFFFNWIDCFLDIKLLFACFGGEFHFYTQLQTFFFPILRVFFPRPSFSIFLAVPKVLRLMRSFLLSLKIFFH